MVWKRRGLQKGLHFIYYKSTFYIASDQQHLNENVVITHQTHTPTNLWLRSSIKYKIQIAGYEENIEYQT